MIQDNEQIQASASGQNNDRWAEGGDADGSSPGFRSKSVGDSDEESGCGLLDILLVLLLVGGVGFAVWKFKFADPNGQAASRQSAAKGGKRGAGDENLISGGMEGEEDSNATPQSWWDGKTLGVNNKVATGVAAAGTLAAVGLGMYQNRTQQRTQQIRRREDDDFTQYAIAGAGVAAAAAGGWAYLTGKLSGLLPGSKKSKKEKELGTKRDRKPGSDVTGEDDKNDSAVQRQKRSEDTEAKFRKAAKAIADHARIDKEHKAILKLSKEIEVAAAAEPCGVFTLKIKELSERTHGLLHRKIVFEDELNFEKKPVLKNDIEECGLKAGDALVQFRYFCDAPKWFGGDVKTKNARTWSGSIETIKDFTNDAWENTFQEVAENTFENGDHQLCDIKFERKKVVTFSRGTDTNSKEDHHDILKNLFKTKRTLSRRDYRRVMDDFDKTEGQTTLCESLRRQGIRPAYRLSWFKDQENDLECFPEDKKKWQPNFAKAVKDASKNKPLVMIFEGKTDISKFVLAAVEKHAKPDAEAKSDKSRRRMTARADRFQRVREYQAGTTNKSLTV